MEVKNNLKRSLSLGLAGLVGFESTAMAAGDYWDDILDNSLMNVTPGGKIVEKDASGNVMQTTYHTGSFSFKFGGAFNYPEPIINLSAPKISAGCGGLSIKGMFGSIIGLDRLEAMLKNAGASLAWGIAVGLIYSLPGIGAAFKMINNWAKKIQQLLANACQSGIAIGQAIAEKSGFKDAAQDNWLSRADNAVAGLDQQLKTKLNDMGISKYFDDNMTFGMPSDSTPNDEEINDNWKQFLIGGLLYYSISTNALMSYLKSMDATEFANFINIAVSADSVGDFSTIKPFSKFEFYITMDNGGTGGTNVFDMSRLFGLKSGLSLSEKEQISRLFTTAASIRYVGTDLITTNEEAVPEFAKNVACIMDSSKTDTEKKVCEKPLIDLAQGTTIPFQMGTPDQKTAVAESFAKKMANYLFHGNTEGVATSVDSSGAIIGGGVRDFKVPSLGYNAVVLPASSEDNQASAKIFIFYPKAKADSKKKSYYWKITNNELGARARSKKVMDKIIKDGDFSTLDTDIPFIVPGIIGKLHIIQQSLPEEQEGLIGKLADYNAYHVVRTALVNLTSSPVNTATLVPAIFVKDSTVRNVGKKLSLDNSMRQQYTNLMSDNGKNLAIVSKFAEDFLAKNFKNVESLEVLNKSFEEQSRRNRVRQLKAMPNSPAGN